MVGARELVHRLLASSSEVFLGLLGEDDQDVVCMCVRRKARLSSCWAAFLQALCDVLGGGLAGFPRTRRLRI